MANLKIDVDEAIDMTLKVSKSEKEKEDTFSKYAPIYMGPTGNVKDAINLYRTKLKNINSALVVGSQGSFAYELALKGVQKIDCFDKNILQYLFFYLYDTTIRTCNYQDFIENFTSKSFFHRNQRLDTMLSEWLLFDVLENMEPLERDYWSKLYRKTGINKLLETNLFRTHYPLYLEYLKRYSSVYDEKSYYKLQNILRKREVDINYHICDITDLYPYFSENKYDLIMFDNILQYYKFIPKLDNVYDINKFVKEKCSKLLNENGVIQIGYGFEISAEAVKKMLKRDRRTTVNALDNMLIQIRIAHEIEDGFFPNMIREYYNNGKGSYSLDFISAVEETDGHKDSENLLLTYKK